MDVYVDWVTRNPMFSAALHFAILGTLGEVFSFFIRKKAMGMPCTGLQLAAKMVGWALLGIIIKYGFAGMKGFTHALLDHDMLPDFMASGLGWAFAVSVLTNLLFGPQMMFFHRLTDNLIMKQRGYEGITRAWWTLIWFWIPAHTLTFALPREYQIGLAAIWSVVLGVILGLSQKR